MRFELIFEGSYTPLFLKVHTSPLRFNPFVLVKYPTFSCFLLLNSVKVLNNFILYPDMRQGQNSKLARVGVSLKKAGTTFASTSKTLSLNYLNPYLVNL